MSTISLKFGMHARNWPRIDFQPLEFNFEFNFIFGDFRGPGFAKLQQRVIIVLLYMKLKTCSRSQKMIQNNYFD